MKNLETRLRASVAAMVNSMVTLSQPKLIVGYAPRLFIDPFIKNYETKYKSNLINHISLSVNMCLDYAPEKRKVLNDNSSSQLSLHAFFPDLKVNTPFLNKRYLVAYTELSNKRFNELLWPVDVSLAECLRRTGYGRKNGARATDLTRMVPFLQLTITENWIIDGMLYVVNKVVPISLVPAYASRLHITDQTSLYFKVNRHWEKRASFTAKSVTSSDGHNTLVGAYTDLKPDAPDLLLFQFDGSLTRCPIIKDVDLPNAKRYNSMSFGLDQDVNDTCISRAVCPEYFPRNNELYYDHELMTVANGLRQKPSHDVVYPNIAPQWFGLGVDYNWN